MPLNPIQRRDIKDPVRAAYQERTARAVESDPEPFLAAYQARADTHGGRYVAADLHHADLCRRQDAMAQPLTAALNAEWHRLDDLVLDQGVIMLDLEPKIAAIPAVSQAGVQAKAAAVARMSRFYKDDNGAALLRSLLADLLPAGRA